MNRLPRVAPLLLLLLAFAAPASAGENVVFTYRAPQAGSVGVAGSFNDWRPEATPMAKEGDLFRTSVFLPDGYHRYKFVVDGKTWVEDPNATEWDPAPKGTNNCMVRVGPRERFRRDFKTHPVVVALPPAERIVAMGDVHGALDRFFGQLSAAGLSGGTPADPRWTGGDAVLVLTGDYMDRGDESKEVVDLVMALERMAPESGGRVVALMGNHEHMRILGLDVHPETRRAFERAGLDFAKAMAPDGTYGAWIRDRPIACLGNGVLFVHGGLDAGACGTDPECKSFDPEIFAKRVEAAIRDGRWGAAEFGRRSSVLWARDWWDDEVGVRRALKAWGAQVCVFGHTPDALGPEGKISHKDGRLVRIDVGINKLYNHSEGAFLEIARDGQEFAFTAHPVDGPAAPLFRKRLLSGAALRKMLPRGEPRDRKAN